MSRLLLISLSWAALAGAGTLPPAPDEALSASFVPPRYRVTDARAEARLEAWLRRNSADSGETWRRGRAIHLSSGALRRLAADSAPGEASRARIGRRLREIAGPGLVEDRVHFVQGYVPDDMGETPDPNPDNQNPDCKNIPQWPLLNDWTKCGSVPGTDIGMSRVWERFDGSDSLVIAVLDAGINFLHPDLKGRWFVNRAEADGLPGVDDDNNGFIDDSTGWDFVDGDNRPQDYNGHGTYISGQIAASFDNALGVAGMLPRARILPIRVLGTTGNGYSGDIADGLRYAAKMGATAVNFSIGIPDVGVDTVIRNGFIALRDLGIPVAAASANNARDLDAEPRSPSNFGFANVYNVASHGQSGNLSGFSNYGANSVDLAAPGEYIATTAIPAPIEVYRETFEDSIAQRWCFSATLNSSCGPAAPTSGFNIGSDTLEGTKSLRWNSGNSATAVIDSIDLRGKGGGQVSFILNFTRANAGDKLWVEVCRQGSPCYTNPSGGGWVAIALINSNVAKKTLAFGLGEVDHQLFRLRFGADFIGTGSRLLRIDDVRMKHGDEMPGNQNQYIITGGTSMAAPYVAGYAALMRLACARMGVPFTRERMLAGVTATPALAGKVKTGARLDVAKGLDFYLRTLPELAISDSTRTAWPSGTQVAYSLSVRDSSGQPLSGWTFSAKDSIGGSLSGAAYAGPSGPDGLRAVRFKAEKPPLTLRRMMRFQVNASGVSLAAAGRTEPLLRIGNRAFLLPASAARGTRVLRIELYGADGRTLRVVEGELVLPADDAAASEYRVEGFPAAGVRAWLDGAPLKAAR